MARARDIDPWPHIARVVARASDGGAAARDVRRARPGDGRDPRAPSRSPSCAITRTRRSPSGSTRARAPHTRSAAARPSGRPVHRARLRRAAALHRAHGGGHPGAASATPELILSLGCESVLNLPVLFDGRVLGTVNLLHEARLVRRGRSAAAV